MTLNIYQIILLALNYLEFFIYKMPTRFFAILYKSVFKLQDQKLGLYSFICHYYYHYSNKKLMLKFIFEKSSLSIFSKLYFLLLL